MKVAARLVEDLLDQQTALTKALFASAGDREIHTPEAVEEIRASRADQDVGALGAAVAR